MNDAQYEAVGGWSALICFYALAAALVTHIFGRDALAAQAVFVAVCSGFVCVLTVYLDPRVRTIR